MAKIVKEKFDTWLEKQNKEYSEDLYIEMDKKLALSIMEGNFYNLIGPLRIETELYLKFDEMFKETKNFIESESNKNILKEFFVLGEKNNEKIYLTRTFKAYIKMAVIDNYEYDIGIDVFKNIGKYLKYTNEQYLLVNARTATSLINASRIHKYKKYAAVKKILKKMKESYDIEKYRNIIQNRQSLDRVKFFDFVREINKLKIDKGIIPYDICEYLILEMLKPDSVISVDYKFWADFRECIFCDFLTNMQIKKYKISDYYNFVKKMDDARGKYKGKHDEIILDEDIIYNFSNVSIRALITAFHELIHLEQDKMIKKENFSGYGYQILKENIIANYLEDFKKKKYWIMIKEMYARKNAIEDTIDYLKKLQLDINTLKVFYNSKRILLDEYKTIVCDDFKKCLIKRKYGNLKININQKFNSIAKKNPKIISENSIFKYEYNNDGTKKKLNEMINGLENALINKELSKENIKAILKCSLLDTTNYKTFGTTVKKIRNYKYKNSIFKKLALELINDTIVEEKDLLKYMDKSELKSEIEINLNI